MNLLWLVALLRVVDPHEATITVTLQCPTCVTAAKRESCPRSLMLLCLNGPKGSVKRKFLMYDRDSFYGYEPIDTTVYCRACDLDSDGDCDLRDYANWENGR